MQVADELVRLGYAPIVPQLSVLWEMISGHKTHEEWLDMDFSFVRVCKALCRIPGASKGADKEVQFAHSIEVPVFLCPEKTPVQMAQDFHHWYQRNVA